MDLAGTRLLEITSLQAFPVPGRTRHTLNSELTLSGENWRSTEGEAFQWSSAQIYKLQPGLYLKKNRKNTQDALLSES